MQCRNCHKENPPQAKFCLECGNGLAISCGNCSTELPSAARFCFACGQAVDNSSPSMRVSRPERYIPPHLAEKILTTRGILEGERKQVTVLFADLKSSLELLADRDPEEARKIIDPVLEAMIESVHRYEGTVNQIMGDGIMALFGAPLAHEDHAVRACYAALALQSAMKRFGDSLRRTHGVEIQARVGLNSGEVVVRTIGNDLSMEYSAIGQTTHLASRMEQLATPGTIRLTAHTLRFAEGFIQVAPLGPIPVKGLPEPIEVHELTGLSGLRTRMQASAARGLTRFVGRHTELQILGEALKRAESGRGEVVALVGDPGVGKSRLAWEFAHSHRTQGWLVLEAGSVSYGKATAFRPLIDLLKSYFQIEERDGDRRIREKIVGKLVMLDRSLETSLAAFLSILSVPFEDTGWTALHPSQRRQLTLGACRNLVLRESQIQPLLLAFEDLHWIDEETQAFLDMLLDSVPTARLCLLVNYRPEYNHRWGNRSYFTLMRVDPLPAESAEELLSGMVGNDPGLAKLRQFLIERTEGNPFFIEESVRTLVEIGALTGERGNYRLASPFEKIQVPGRVQSVIAARIDRLSPEHKQLLQTAAVIGKDVPYALLLAIVDVPEPELRVGLSHLQSAEFLYETAVFPDSEYTFKHALTHEVAYGGILLERRRAAHARILGAIENIYRNRLAEHIEKLAHHAVRGELWEKAFNYLKQAGDKAVARSANREAVNYYHQALEAIERLPESKTTSECAIDLRLALRSALHPLGEFDRVFETLRQAQTLAKAIDDRQREGRVLSYLAQSFRLIGDYRNAIGAGEEAVAIARTFDDLAIQAPANFHLGQAFFHFGDHERAIEFHIDNINTLQGDLAKNRLGMAGIPVVFSRGHLSWSYAELGHFSEGIATWREAVRLADEVKHPFSEAFAKYCGGFVYLRLGEIERAVAQLEPGLAQCKSVNARLEMPFVGAFLGLAYSLQGKHRDAIELTTQAVDEMKALNIVSGRSWLTGMVALAHMHAGDLPKATGLAEEANDLALKQGERGWTAWTGYALGLIRLTTGETYFDVAREALEKALDIADTLGMRPLLARCDLALGQMYRRAKEPERAHHHLSKAAALLREMEMSYWVQKTESELQSLR